jgi:hypothetical protein
MHDAAVKQLAQVWIGVSPDQSQRSATQIPWRGHWKIFARGKHEYVDHLAKRHRKRAGDFLLLDPAGEDAGFKVELPQVELVGKTRLGKILDLKAMAGNNALVRPSAFLSDTWC